jgi:hypothetical protein
MPQGLGHSPGFTVQFSRYADTDPLCCPSRISTVTYTIDLTGGQPVVTPVSATTTGSE